MPPQINISTGIQNFQCEIHEYPCDVGIFYYLLITIMIIYVITDILFYTHKERDRFSKIRKHFFKGREDGYEEM